MVRVRTNIVYFILLYILSMVWHCSYSTIAKYKIHLDLVFCLIFTLLCDNDRRCEFECLRSNGDGYLSTRLVVTAERMTTTCQHASILHIYSISSGTIISRSLSPQHHSIVIVC